MIYNIIRIFLYPFLLFFLLFKPKQMKFVRERFFQDFSSLKKNEEYIWIHCSSVGEINLVDSLIKDLKVKYNKNLLITLFTDTGFNVANSKYSNDEKITVLKFPIDDFFLIKKIVSRITLSHLIIVETELWPNLINIVSKKSKIILANGRISNKSYPRYLKFKWFLKKLFKKIDKFCMQTELDKERIISLGADSQNVFITGNLKFDITFEIFTKEIREELKKQILSDGRKIFVAGSTRKGEDEYLLKVFSNLENTLLVLVPRHIERTKEIEEILISQNLSYEKFSNIENCSLDKEVDVIIVDKIGVLRKFYSISDIAFVGGTLVNIGGHSLVEPLFYGKTPIFGPYLQNVKDIAKEILDLNLGYKISNEEEFLSAIKTIESGVIEKDRIDAFFKVNKNASKNILKIMEEK